MYILSVLVCALLPPINTYNESNRGTGNECRRKYNGGKRADADRAG